jgi:hypothetical protein
MFSSSKRRIATFSIAIAMLLGTVGYVVTNTTAASTTQVASASIPSVAVTAKSVAPTSGAQTYRATRSSSAS